MITSKSVQQPNPETNPTEANTKANPEANPQTSPQTSPETKQNPKHQNEHRNRDNKPEINDSAPQYRVGLPDAGSNSESSQPGVEGLSASQQKFVLKFCSQLASVIEACEQSESAEIEVGRRQINSTQIKVKLQAERELTLES